MTKPLRVKVGHRTFVIEFHGDTSVEDDGNWGDCNKRTGIIRINANGRPRDTQAETVVHELLHAVIWDAGTEWESERQEEICQVLGPRLTALIGDNPEVIDHIQAMLGPQTGGWE